MRLTVFGSDYIGLTTGACMVQMGDDVDCEDIDRDEIVCSNESNI